MHRLVWKTKCALHNGFTSLRVNQLLGYVIVFASLFTAPSFGACSGMENDSHFRLLFESSSVRVFELELERLESTASYCQ